MEGRQIQNDCCSILLRWMKFLQRRVFKNNTVKGGRHSWKDTRQVVVEELVVRGWHGLQESLPVVLKPGGRC